MKKSGIEANTNESFDDLMKGFRKELNNVFGKGNVLDVHNGKSANPNSKLFLIRADGMVDDSIVVDSALIIKVRPSHKDGWPIYRISSFYEYPHLTRKAEIDIVDKAGRALETMVSGLVLCESGDVKVKLSKATRLDELFKVTPSRAI